MCLPEDKLQSRGRLVRQRIDCDRNLEQAGLLCLCVHCWSGALAAAASVREGKVDVHLYLDLYWLAVQEVRLIHPILDHVFGSVGE